jgi:hypothetical protein
MSNPNNCLLVHEWGEVQNILKDLYINHPEFELTIAKRIDQDFVIQFKNLDQTSKLKPYKN